MDHKSGACDGNAQDILRSCSFSDVCPRMRPGPVDSCRNYHLAAVSTECNVILFVCSGTRLTYHSSVSQEGISAEVFKGSERWLHRLFAAKKRYWLSILNYMVTSNHIHLLVFDGGGRDVIPKSIQLIARRSGQEYNTRKSRKGAFWEDRHHATAVEGGEHLLHCLVYIDLNMVRAKVIDHPSEWLSSGYSEIQEPRKRYALIDCREATEPGRY